MLLSCRQQSPGGRRQRQAPYDRHRHTVASHGSSPYVQMFPGSGYQRPYSPKTRGRPANPAVGHRARRRSSPASRTCAYGATRPRRVRRTPCDHVRVLRTTQAEIAGLWSPLRDPLQRSRSPDLPSVGLHTCPCSGSLPFSHNHKAVCVKSRPLLFEIRCFPTQTPTQFMPSTLLPLNS